MEHLTDDYVAFVQEHISIAPETCGDPQVLIEQCLDFPHVVPGGFGTGDCLIIADSCQLMVTSPAWTDNLSVDADGV